MVKDINNKIEKSKNWAYKICDKLISNIEKTKYKIILFNGLFLGFFISYMTYFEKTWYIQIMSILMIISFIHSLFGIKKCISIREALKKQKEFFRKSNNIELIDDFCIKMCY